LTQSTFEKLLIFPRSCQGTSIFCAVASAGLNIVYTWFVIPESLDADARVRNLPNQLGSEIDYFVHQSFLYKIESEISFLFHMLFVFHSSFANHDRQERMSRLKKPPLNPLKTFRIIFRHRELMIIAMMYALVDFADMGVLRTLGTTILLFQCVVVCLD
jgi:hypothetical protein